MSDRMAQLQSTSAILGEYMLRGYTLTDLSCDSCGVTPLMREPASAAAREDRSPIQFCALCDGRPENAAPGASTGTTTETVLDPHAGSHTVTHEPLTATSSAHSTSRAGPSITDDIPPYISPYDSTPSSGPSTSQADKAAGSISSLLLQGYSLLGDNCPNPICRGIPLVGYPKKKDGTKDGRRMCVSCGGAWVDQADLEGMSIVPPTSAAGPTGRSASRIINVPRQGGAEPPEVGGVLESPRSKARRELYEQGERIVQETESKKKRANEPVVSSKKGKDVVADVRDGLEEEMDLDEQSAPLPAGGGHITDASTGEDEMLDSALAHTTSALASTLESLASSLQQQTAQRKGENDDSRFFVDVKLHTEAIKDVLGVIQTLKALQ